MQPMHSCPDRGMSRKEGGLYVHTAFCRKKCIYCDFFSAGVRIADWHRYMDALISELTYRMHELPCPLKTVYVGGGTPSLIPPSEFIRFAFFLSHYTSEVEEFTIEVNPDDVSEEMLLCWKRGGVNRLSMGIQSFDDRLLKSIGRTHDGKTAREAVTLARRYFDNISIDLMFGLPGQSVDMWCNDISCALDLEPEHISAYSLMYEAGTALSVLRDRGAVVETPEETSEAMLGILIDRLEAAGYDHYEISNFAKPGCRSRHNSSYWRQMPYLGIGPSAHSYDGNSIRTANIADLKAYLRHWTPLSEHPVADDCVLSRENLSSDELREEYIMTRLRTREGIPLDDYVRRFGHDERGVLLRKSKDWLNRGFLELHSGCLSLSESAIMISDAIILDLV